MNALFYIRYMKRLIYLPILFLGLISLGGGKQDTGENFVRRLHREYVGKWYTTLTFEQKTKFYQNGVCSGEQTWYEAGIYPHLFRIDFGQPDSGNTYISRNDTAYLFRKGKNVRTVAEVNELLFLFGGMYFLPEDSVVKKLNRMGYDLQKMHTKKQAGTSIVVIGATKGDTLSPQIWYDAKRHYIVRILRDRNGELEDIRPGKHIRLGDGWCETEVIFYVNGKLVQEEFYSNCKANEPLDPRIFDPKLLGKYHWMKK